MGKQKIAGAEKTWKEGDSYYDKVFTQRLNLWKINDTVKRYMLSPALGETLCTQAGVSGMRVWHDRALIRESYGNPTGWHLDNPYWSFHSPAAISIWIALDDATPQNGCLYFVPGTQRLATYDMSTSRAINFGVLQRNSSRPREVLICAKWPSTCQRRP